MEERIALLEKQIEEQKIVFETYVKGEVEKTNAITSFISGYRDFLTKYQLEHDAVLKKFEELDIAIDLIIKLRQGDEKIKNLNEQIEKFK
jgi:hypothetical protein